MIRGAAVVALLGTQAAADCRQALALGLDVSGSVDAREYRLQLDGVANALRAPSVVEALLGFGQPPVQIAVFEWSGADAQRLIVPWVSLANDDAIERVAARLNQTTRGLEDDRTAIGNAISFGLELIAMADECPVRTLDISGDGRSSHGPRPETVFVPRDISINGLVIGADSPGIGDRRQMQLSEIVAYYGAAVIRGPGAFIEAARGFEDFEAAMERKLLREIEAIVVGRLNPLDGFSGRTSAPAPASVASAPMGHQ